MVVLVTIVIQSLVSAFFLWLGLKITKVQGKFTGMLAVAFISNLVSLIPIPIPFVGSILTFVVMLMLISKWTDADWPSAILVVVVAWILTLLVGFFLIALLVGLVASLFGGGAPAPGLIGIWL